MPNEPKQNGNTPLTGNLLRLIIIRMIAIAGESAVIYGLIHGLKMPLPVEPLAGIIVTYLVFNLATWWWLRNTAAVTSLVFFLQLCFDVAVLALLLYFAGGATNPFVSLLLLPLVVAAAVLEQAYVWTMALVVATIYGTLMIVYQPLPHITSQAGHDFDWHVTGMGFSFLVGVALIVFFVLRMAESLRERDRVLMEARERAMRDEKLVALGTLAAGAAHELGTPLSTMAVLSQDLAREYADNAELAPRLTILRQQITRCKESLSMISVSAGQAKAGSGGRLRLDDFLDNVVLQWKIMRPQAHVRFQADGVRPAPWIVSEEGLSQAIISFLNNAADSSPNDVEMNCEWDATRLSITVADRGGGISPADRERLGRESFSTKSEGHGLGMLLAHAIIERLDGQVTVWEREGGGACIHLELDLTRLLVND